jgi:hypothetical protein
MLIVDTNVSTNLTPKSNRFTSFIRELCRTDLYKKNQKSGLIAKSLYRNALQAFNYTLLIEQHMQAAVNVACVSTGGWN